MPLFFSRLNPLTLTALTILLPACASRPTARTIVSSRNPPPEPALRADLPPMESLLPGSFPAWWSPESRPELGSAQICAMGQAADQAIAFDLAMRNATNAGRITLAHEPTRVVALRAAASHALSGQYRVMVLTRADGPSADALHAAASPAVPAPTPPPALQPTPATAFNHAEPAVGAPPWYHENVQTTDGRIHASARADGPTLRDARRLAVDNARAKLAATLNAEPTDVQTPRLASERLPDGRFRVYVQASANAH